MKRFTVCFAITIMSCLLAVTAALDDEAPAGYEKKEPSKFEVETELMEVRAVVTDKKGHVVEGLKKEDFELLENSESREISHFTISKVEEAQRDVRAGDGEPQDTESKLQQARAQLSQPPARTILLYVDALHLSFTSLNWVKQALSRFIDKQLTDQDLVAFTSSETLGVAQQFTRDRKILRYAVEQVRYSPARRSSLLTPNLAVGVLDNRASAIRLAIDVVRREESIFCPCSMVRELAYNKASEVLLDASYARQNTLSIIAHFARQMADLPGKRMIVVFSDGFTLYSRSGDQANEELHEAVSRAVRSGVTIYSIDAKGLTAPTTIDAERKGPTLESATDKLLFECLQDCKDPEKTPPFQVEACIRECKAKYPSVYLCEDHDPQICDFPAPGELDAYIESSEIEKLNGLNSLAAETGGRMYEKANDLNGAIEKALDDNRFFYVLSYYLTGGKEDDRFRRIEVRVRDHPEYTVRTPRGFWPSALKEKPEDAAKTPQQRLVRAMRSPLPVTDLGVSARADYIETEADDSKVSLSVCFEGDRFQYREQERGGAVELEILSAIYDSSGKQVEGVSAHVEGNLTQEDMRKAKTSGYRFTQRLMLKPGVYQARIGVREEGTDRMGTASTWVEVPEFAEDKLEMSSLILSNPLEMDLVDTEGIGVNELEQIKMVQGVPMYGPNDIFYYSFRVHRSNRNPTRSGFLILRELLQGGAPVRTETWQPASLEQRDADGKGWLDLDGELDLSALDSGVYELRISVKEDPADNAVQRTITFGIL
jgi:VWFA-related protein